MKRISGLLVLMRAITRMFPAAATVLAVSGLLLAAPSAANAGSIQICAVPQSNDCIDAPNLNAFTHVVGGSPGRDMIIQAVDGGVELQFVRDTSMCVAAENDGVKVDIKPCFGSDGVVWIISTDPHDLSKKRFESRDHAGSYLTGLGNGSNFILLPGTPIQDFVYQ